MSASIYLHPVVTRNPLCVTKLELRTGMRAFLTGGRHAELLPVEGEWWRADSVPTDYTGSRPDDGPEAA